MSEFNPKENHLKGQTSPYLLQHLYNPVDWYPWGKEALEKARSENRPLLVSIGYSACHWCHVMERESFEDHSVARLMNEHFVCIKVDREERPDIDHLYMNAVQLLSERGGWPLNCFALPDGRPFWGATYFPKEQWKNILIRIHELYQHQYDDLLEQAQQLTEGITKSSLLPVSQKQTEEFSAESIHRMADTIIEGIDMKEGGTKGAPKFPLPALHEFLIHYHAQNPDKDTALQAVNLSLQKMAKGGIYDQIGGGFSRYSVDEYWKVPHFEKMLYDNAQLISLYSKAWKINPLPIYQQITEETIAFVKRELQSQAATFYSALDADSEGKEGKYYVWTEKDFHQVLGHEAALAGEYYNIGGKGLWEEGNNILMPDKDLEEFARMKKMDVFGLREKIVLWKEKLLSEREKRIKPGLDTKVIVSWNALMIEALAEAGSTFGKQSWIEDAQKTADYILKHAIDKQGKLAHTITNEKLAVDGFLEDYAYMIKALIKLAQASINPSYFVSAKNLLNYTLANFSSPDTNMFAFSSDKGEQLAAPYFDFQDNVIASSNSTMARNLFYLGNIFENQQWIDRSRNMLHDMKPQIEQYGRWTANWGILWLHHQQEFFVLAVTGPHAHVAAAKLYTTFLPDTLVCAAHTKADHIAVLENRFSEKETLIYPCTLNACLQPENEAEAVIRLLRQ